MAEFERRVSVIPAYDKRPQKPGDPNYGVHGARLIFALVGEDGAVELEIQTGWQLPHVHEEWDREPARTTQRAYGANLRYHSREPRMLGEGESYSKCSYLGDVPCCYCGSSGLNAHEYFTLLVAEGDEGVWERLEVYYWRIFQTHLTEQLCSLCDAIKPIDHGKYVTVGSERRVWVCVGCQERIERT